MNIILILTASLLLIIPFTYRSHAQSSGVTFLSIFDSESDDNANLSYAPGMGNLSNLDPDDFVVGQAHEVNTTINSLSEPSNPNLGQINPIQEYKTNSSNWNIMTDTNPDLNQSFVTDFSNSTNGT